MNQQPPQKGQGKQPTKSKEDPFSNFLAMLMNFAMLFGAVTIGLYYFFGTGDEVNCGTGLGAGKQVCYLPGMEGIEYMAGLTVFTFLLCFYAISQWQKKNKE